MSPTKISLQPRLFLFHLLFLWMKHDNATAEISSSSSSLWHTTSITPFSKKPQMAFVSILTPMQKQNRNKKYSQRFAIPTTTTTTTAISSSFKQQQQSCQSLLRLSASSSSSSVKEGENEKVDNKDSSTENVSGKVSAVDNDGSNAAKSDLVKWNVYICQSTTKKEDSDTKTTIPPILDAFQKLLQSSSSSSFESIITVQPAKITSKSSKGKSPTVRCIQQVGGDEEEENVVRALEVNNVDSVDKVYRILTKYMNIKGIDPSARECLKWSYKGNAHLEKGEISSAIESYDKAIAANYTPQEGMILLMRSTAYLRRAFNHQSALRDVVSDLANTVTDSNNIKVLYNIALNHPSMSGAIFRRVLADCRVQDKKFQQTKYRHGLYEYALLHAAQDSLRATELLPDYAKTWLRAGDSLAELRKLKESIQYYERAMEIDPSLADTLAPTIQRLQESQKFIANARANGWTEDTLRLALDVAG